jgi:uncharacterized protein (UPF0333 family)
MMLEFLAVVILLAVLGVGLYVYASRYREFDDSERAA